MVVLTHDLAQLRLSLRIVMFLTYEMFYTSPETKSQIPLFDVLQSPTFRLVFAKTDFGGFVILLGIILTDTIW